MHKTFHNFNGSDDACINWKHIIVLTETFLPIPALILISVSTLIYIYCFHESSLAMKTMTNFFYYLKIQTREKKTARF